MGNSRFASPLLALSVLMTVPKLIGWPGVSGKPGPVPKLLGN
jgi:hypothetical protein